MNDDLISREALKKVMWDEAHFITTTECGKEEACFGLTGSEIEQIIDNAQPIETTIENLISTLSVEELKATTWFKVDTPSGEAVCFRREKTGHWEYVTHYCRRYRVCSECHVEKEDDRASGWNYCHYCGAKMTGGVKND